MCYSAAITLIFNVLRRGGPKSFGEACSFQKAKEIVLQHPEDFEKAMIHGGFAEYLDYVRNFSIQITERPAYAPA